MELTIKKVNLPKKTRIICISDIHGNYDGLINLLKNIGYRHKDILFILGDSIEKGPNSLEVIHFLMMLEKHNKVYFVKGNCDAILERDFNDDHKVKVMYRYLCAAKHSIWHEFFSKLQVEINDVEDFRNIIPTIFKLFKKEIDFLNSMPVIIDTDKFTFVHAGLQTSKLEDNDIKFCMKNDAYLKHDSSFEKYVVVGHWPNSNYGDKLCCCNPIVDEIHKKIAIDGGNQVKTEGQLNAFIISGIEGMHFSYKSYEDTPMLTITNNQKESTNPFSIKWGDNEVEVIKSNGKICEVRHLRTGYIFTFPTKKIYQENNKWYCHDYTNYFPNLKKGEKVYVYKQVQNYYLIKKDGLIGWYKKEEEHK
ncbi:MAG: metallophosphoesterase [Erysipelotrichales bacterium]|nr:metallophosphoesterase [Erysipelotrichales bacterium]